ncbi:MAG: hypothetical protein RLZ96_374 [Actinomycetota bacterium]
MPSEPSPEKLEQRAKNILLHQLSRSMKTRHQLAQVLEKREIPSEISLRVLDRFQEAQLIDDAAFARAFVNSRMSAGGKSKRIMARELSQKGVAPDLIEQALEPVSSEIELELVRDLVKKRAARLQGLDPQTRQRRMLGFLARRGFSTSLALSVMREIE